MMLERHKVIKFHSPCLMAERRKRLKGLKRLKRLNGKICQTQWTQV